MVSKQRGLIHLFVFTLTSLHMATNFFTGKIARTKASYERDDFAMDKDLQNLNLETDRSYPNLMKGFRGGMASLWKVVFDD